MDTLQRRLEILIASVVCVLIFLSILVIGNITEQSRQGDYVERVAEAAGKRVKELQDAVTEQGDYIGSLQRAVKQLQVETMAAQQARVKELDLAIEKAKAELISATIPTPTPTPTIYVRPLTEEEKEFFEKMPNGGWYMGETELFKNMFSTPTMTPMKFNIPCATQGFTIEEYYEYLKHLPTATPIIRSSTYDPLYYIKQMDEWEDQMRRKINQNRIENSRKIGEMIESMRKASEESARIGRELEEGRKLDTPTPNQRSGC